MFDNNRLHRNITVGSYSCFVSGGMHRSIELDQFTVFAAPGDDTAFLQRTDRKHRPFVNVSRHFGDVIRA